LTNDTSSGKIVTNTESQIRWALEYIITTYDEKNLKTRKDVLRDDLKQWMLDNCEQDENGNYIYEFDRPVQLEDTQVYGLVAQRRVSEFINEDKAWEIVDKYGVRDEVVEEVTTEELNFDMLYALNQQGIISDEDIDSILDFKESFALMKMES
jgi:hypothetical protein